MPLPNRDKEARLTQERVKELLYYDPCVGAFYRRVGCFKRKAGDRTGNISSRGYETVMINRTNYLSHRLAFFYMTGEWPVHNVDHLNGDSLDNRWTNLKDRPQSENVARSRSNKSIEGGRGIRFRKGGWEATIKVDEKAQYLGRYKTKEDAAEAYKAACISAGRSFLFDAPHEHAPRPPVPTFALRAVAVRSPKPEVTPEELRRLFAYDPVTGTLTRKTAARGQIHPVGEVAGSIQKRWGYRIVKVRSMGLLAHRIAWAIMTGAWPDHPVDHINGAPDDNRWSNLRAVDASQNMINRGTFRNNRLGLKGVVPVGSRFLAQINVNNTVHRLGRFATAEEAAVAYADAATKLHGEFARTA